MGDIDALAASIKEVGLLHLPVVDGDGVLVCGERRVMAVKKLGWEEVSVRTIKNLGEALEALKAERDENVCRKAFAPTEAVAMGERLESFIKPEAAERKSGAIRERDSKGRSKSTGGKLPPVVKGKTRDQVGAAVGMSGKTYEKAKAVIAAAKADSALESVVEEMDRTGKVDRAFREIQIAAPPPEPVVMPGFPDGPFRAIVIDPPWPISKIVFDRRPVEKAVMDYATMTLEEIEKLPIAKLADPRGCHIYLWVTHRYLPAGLKLFEAWGVRYECLLTWNKPTAQPLWWRFLTEHCLFGKIGTLPPLKKGCAVSFSASQQKHSHKPDEFFDLVRKVSRGPRLTMFDYERKDFEQWGITH
jgi:ParB family chromosome partitioning protein